MKHAKNGTHFYCNKHTRGKCCGCKPRKDCKYIKSIIKAIKRQKLAEQKLHEFIKGELND